MAFADIPYLRLSALYFAYFALVGVMSPYWPVYLSALGFQGTEIGLIVALPMLTRLLAPSAWGWLADKSGRYVAVIQFGAALSFVSFCGLFFFTEFWGVILFTCLFTFFWNAILPQFEVVTLDYLQHRSHFYSYIRLWGSIGFIVSVVGLGAAFEVLSAVYVPWVIWGLLFAILLSTLYLRQPQHNPKQPQLSRSFLSSLCSRTTLSFFGATFFLHLSHGGFYGFYSLYLIKFGYSSTAIGLLWAVGVVAEILLFIKVPWFFKRFGLKYCLVMSIVAAALRWYVVAVYPGAAVLMVVVQGLHALTFGLAHAVAIEFVRRRFSAQVKGKAQALYSAACFGGGGALGAYISGYLWGLNPAWCFLAASLFACLGALIGLFGMVADGQLRMTMSSR